MKTLSISYLKICVTALLASSAVCFTSLAQAQSMGAYPERPVTIVVPFAAGSVTDILARHVAQGLGSQFGQSFIVENKPGADGNIGAGFVAAATPDGYTLMMGAASTNSINPSLHKNLRFNAIEDFVPVINVASMPNVLVVHPENPASNVVDFITAAKKNSYSFASSGSGGSMHLSGEMFKNMAQIPDYLHIPYKGGSAPVTDVIGNRVISMFCNLPLCLPHIQSGKMKALGVTSGTRSPLLPQIPTIAESGLPNYEVIGWFGLFAPKGVPADIVNRLNQEAAAYLNSPKTKELLLAQGAVPIGDTPQEFAKFVNSEYQRWAKVIKEAGIQQ